jgi:hypothetical protein
MSTSEPELHRLVRARIDDRRLPCDPPAKMWGGRGTGALCEVCGEPIGPDEIEYEVQLVANQPLICRLHLRCHAAWCAECDRRQDAR